MSPESIVILVGILASIAVGMFSRLWGRILGLAVVLGILAFGIISYAGGRPLAFFGRPLAAPWFYGVIGALLVYEVFALVGVLRARRRERDAFESSFEDEGGAPRPPGDDGAGR